MPLYKSITVDSTTHVLVWKIEESLAQLSCDIALTAASQLRLEAMRSMMHRCGFVSVRQLLAILGYTDHDLYYNNFGKPFLRDGKQISITHSYAFSAIIISDKPIGIDIEKQRAKIDRIASKFVKNEADFLSQHLDRIRMLTVVWCVKESLYKLYAQPGLSFAKHITVQSFDLDNPCVSARIDHNGVQSVFDVSFLEFEGFTCTYAMPCSVLTP